MGDPSLGVLPIVAHQESIAAMVRENQVSGLRAPPASGKTMKMPEILLSVLNMGDDWSTRKPILLVVPSQYGAEQVVNGLVHHFRWSRGDIHLRTGRDDTDVFSRGWTRLSVITYGILWRYLTDDGNREGNSAAGHGSWTRQGPIDRYDGFLLDEFADLQPKQEEAAFILQKLLAQRHWAEKRLVAISASLRPEHVRCVFGDDSAFLSITARLFTLQRCIVAPRDSQKLLEVAVALAGAALQRQGQNQRGNVIIFLPGIAEMLTVQKLLYEAGAKNQNVACQVPLLHSDHIGCDEESELAALDDGGGLPIVALSTLIAARSVTLESMKYVIIHPAVRASAMHASGISYLLDEPVSLELESNMAGRVARTCNGFATFLYDIDDTRIALSDIPRQPRGTNSVADHVAPRGTYPVADDVAAPQLALIVGPPARLHYIRHTCAHLRGRGFTNVKWLRTPDAPELDSFDKDKDAQRRCMMFWYTTVLPALLALELESGVQGAFVFEDTCLLAGNVTYSVVREETRSTPAAVFGYGGYEKSGDGRISWHGTKGLWVTAPWWRQMSTVFENMHVTDFKHWDLWPRT